MKNYRHVSWIALLCVAGATLGLFLAIPREPSYEGKCLSVWLEELSEGHYFLVKNARVPIANSEVAIQVMGEACVPSLLSTLGSKDSRLKLKLLKFSEEHPVVKRTLSAIGISQSTFRRHLATEAFIILGSAGKSAIPELVLMVNDTDADIQAKSITALGGFGAHSKNAIPAILRQLKSKKPVVACAAAWALSRISQDLDVIVPALIENLKSENPYVRAMTATALGRLGDKAQSALPALEPLLNDRAEFTDGCVNYPVRFRVEMAVERIKPRSAQTKVSSGDYTQASETTGIMSLSDLDQLFVPSTESPFEMGMAIELFGGPISIFNVLPLSPSQWPDVTDETLLLPLPTPEFGIKPPSVYP